MELCVFYRCQMFLTQLYIHKANKMCKAVENSSCQVNINHSEPRSKQKANLIIYSWHLTNDRGRNSNWCLGLCSALRHSDQNSLSSTEMKIKTPCFKTHSTKNVMYFPRLRRCRPLDNVRRTKVSGCYCTAVTITNDFVSAKGRLGGGSKNYKDQHPLCTTSSLLVTMMKRA